MQLTTGLQQLPFWPQKYNPVIGTVMWFGVVNSATATHQMVLNGPPFMLGNLDANGMLSGASGGIVLETAFTLADLNILIHFTISA
jgi:hypothetical protein